MFPCVFFLPFDFESVPIKYMDLKTQNKMYSNKNSNKRISKSFVMPRKYKGGLR